MMILKRVVQVDNTLKVLEIACQAPSRLLLKDKGVEGCFILEMPQIIQAE